MQSKEMISNSNSYGMVSRLLSILLWGGQLLAVGLPSTADAAFTTNITSDGTLPTPTSVSPPAGNVYDINGGTIKGTNLFHSFGLFSVGTGDTASFNGPSSIANILGRVTGGQQSMIDGQIRSTISGANLYLMNPAGVVFGRNATLNVGGAFHVTTADYLRFTDNVRFSAVPGAQDSLLSTAPVAAFGFLNSRPAPIDVQQSLLQVSPGKTLSFIGGDITYVGDPVLGILRASHGQINIASVASPGEAVPNQPGFPPALDVSSFAALGTITQSDVASITVSSPLGGGTVVIRGGRFTITDSFINANTTGNGDGAPVGIDIRLTDDLVVSNDAGVQAFTNSAGRAGKIQIVAGDAATNTGSVQLTNGSFIFSGTAGSGKGGDILINTGRVSALSGGAIISGTQVGSGTGGAIDITAGSVLLSAAANPSNGAAIQTFVTSGGTGRGGDLTLTTNSLQILEGAELSTPTFAPGPGGNLTVHASDIFISGSSNPAIFTGIFANTFGTGKGGSLNVTAESIEMTHRATIQGGTFAAGDAGSTTVTTTGHLELRDASSIFTTALRGSGNAGNLNVIADTILIIGTNTTNSFSGEFTGLSSGTGSQGKKGGDLHVTSRTLALTDKGSITAFSDGAGDAGNITLDITDSLIVQGGATIHGSARGSGHGGNITISAGSVTVSGVGQFGGEHDSGQSAIVSQTGVGGGDAGDVAITTGSLTVLDSAAIATDSFGAGKGGHITLSANDVLISGINLGFMQNLLTIPGVTPKDADGQSRAGVFASSFSTGNAGNISITAADRVVMKDGTVTTQAKLADGGNIDIHAVNLVHLVNSSITTSVGTGAGNGGNITIDPKLVVLQNSQILANAFAGTGGKIKIVAGLLLMDPASVIDASSTLGVSGTITIESPLADLSGSLVPLPENFLSAGALLASRCAAGVGGNNSSFVVAGRDGVPAEPGGLLPSPVSPTGAIGVAAAKPATDRQASGLETGTLLALNTWGQDLNSGCVQ